MQGFLGEGISVQSFLFVACAQARADIILAIDPGQRSIGNLALNQHKRASQLAWSLRRAHICTFRPQNFRVHPPQPLWQQFLHEHL